LALDDVRLLLPLDCGLRLDRLEPAFEREPALLEPEVFDFSPDLADREPEVACAILSLPRRVSGEAF
jgi:hypothetical protein